MKRPTIERKDCFSTNVKQSIFLNRNFILFTKFQQLKVIYLVTFDASSNTMIFDENIYICEMNQFCFKLKIFFLKD